jgi:hypothetical protein
MGANGKCAVGERGKVWETRKWQCMAITWHRNPSVEEHDYFPTLEKLSWAWSAS